jgi:hypothetical protein
MKKKAAPAIIATPAITPTTTPAIAPPERPLLDDDDDDAIVGAMVGLDVMSDPIVLLVVSDVL